MSFFFISKSDAFQFFVIVCTIIYLPVIRKVRSTTMAPMLNNTASKTGIHMPGRMVLSTIKISLVESLPKKRKIILKELK